MDCGNKLSVQFMSVCLVSIGICVDRSADLNNISYNF